VDIDKLTREQRAVLRAMVQLDSFDRRHHGTSFRSKDHERAILVGRLEDAIEALADARLGPVPSDSDADEMTDLARATIPEIEKLLRRPGRRPTKTAVATRVEIDRKTLDDWIRRGWLSWPPTGTR